MLKALKNQLRLLSEQSGESIEKRFKHFATFDKAKAHETDLRNFILCLPDILDQTRLWFESDETPSELRRVYWYLLTYVYHSADVLPEEDYGFWGYLDDAYFVGLAFFKTMHEYRLPRTVKNSSDFESQIGVWLEKTREVLPQQTETLDLLFGKLMLGQLEAFNKALADCAVEK